MATPLFTIGYEGLDIERFIAELLDASVEAVADVRAVAISRKKGFSKNRLANCLGAAGLLYRHFAVLGDPKPGRDAARAGNYELFESIYADHLATVPAQTGLLELKRFADTQPTCLLCYERDPDFCHRSRIASALVGSGFIVQNLVADGPLANGRVATLRPRRDAGQGASSSQRQAW